MSSKPVDLYSEQGSRILDIPGWQAFKWRAVPPDTVLVEGAVCTTLFKSGPRKGLPNWSKLDKSTRREIALSGAQIKQFQLAWEKETGKCHKCTGTCRVFQKWSAAEGITYKTCPRCAGTGAAPGTQTASATP